MEHLYQPEEGVFSHKYQLFKDYYKFSSPLPQPHPSSSSLHLVTREEEGNIHVHSSSFNPFFGHISPDGVNNASILPEGGPNPTATPDSGNSFVDSYLSLMSWNVCHFASQQPHAVWPLLNMTYCLILLLGHATQRAVFGRLRAAEHDNLKEQFWNLVFYKVVFVFGVVNVQDVEDAVGWCFFVSLIGFLQLGRQLSQERHNYLILMSDWSRRGQCRRNKILGLLCFIFASSIFLFLAVIGWYIYSTTNPTRGGRVIGQRDFSSRDPDQDSLEMKSVYYDGRSTASESGRATPINFNLGLHSVIFMGCELGLLIIQTTHVLILCIFEQIRTKWWYRGKEEGVGSEEGLGDDQGVRDDEAYSNTIHSINFKFDLISLLFDLVHHVHMLVCCNLFLSTTSLVVSLQMRNRVRKIHRVLKRRQCYLWLSDHIEGYPDAIFETGAPENGGEDRCAICWDALSSQKAKSLPCSHIFHTPCLRQWLLVNMNCPACRHSLLNEKEEKFRPVENRTTRRLYAARPLGLWGFLQTGQALLDLFGGWDPQYDDSYDEEPATPEATPPTEAPSPTTDNQVPQNGRSTGQE